MELSILDSGFVMGAARYFLSDCGGILRGGMLETCWLRSQADNLKE